MTQHSKSNSIPSNEKWNFKKPLVEIDLKTNRNSKMIQTLMKPSVNGTFLFCFENNEAIFVLPPGLSENEIEAFKMEFSDLFEKYAKLVNRKQ